MAIQLTSKNKLIDWIEEVGFVPFFENNIPGFSIAEQTPDRYWFNEDQEGPWQWKGPVILKSHCAYGKFFHNRTGFISKKWFPDFANYRRDGYDFDARFNDGLSRYDDQILYNLLVKNGPTLSKELKRLGNYGKEGRKGFDTTITRLQMQAYILVCNVEYNMAKDGSPYGWGVCRYATCETFYGASFPKKVYQRTPKQSYQRILNHLQKALPNFSKEEIEYFLKP